MKGLIGIKEFAVIIGEILKTDRWQFIACSGDMGEGKSCLTSQLSEEIALNTNTPFTYNDNLTFLRKELKVWVDGDEKGEKQKPEYSAVLADELISMFFKRNWFNDDQIGGIELLNKCRDRHLAVLGNIPNFWDLDSAIYPIVSLWIHIHERGRAWVFQKDRNPFAVDKWHKRENEKRFKRDGHPTKCIGFLTEVYFEDWTPQKKIEYYEVRNTKRKNTEGQGKKQSKNVTRVLKQRDTLIKYVSKENHISQVYISKMIDLPQPLISKILEDT